MQWGWGGGGGRANVHFENKHWETSAPKISSGGGGGEAGGGQMSELHFQLGGKCPLIDLVIGG